MEVNNEVYTKLQQHLEEFTQKWLDNMKDTLLTQLIGFMEHNKHELEHEFGSGKIQELEKESEKEAEPLDK